MMGTFAWRAGTNEQELANEPVTLGPGKRVLYFQEKIELPEFYTYEARFTPDNPSDDSMPQNNEASTFTHIRGSGQVLLIQDHENAELVTVIARSLATNRDNAVQLLTRGILNLRGGYPNRLFAREYATFANARKSEAQVAAPMAICEGFSLWIVSLP